MFADDTQSYSHCAISEIPALVHKLSSCINDLAKSYASLRLQLIPAKTEFIWFGSRINLSRIPERFRSIQGCGSVIECDVVFRDLGVYLDSELSMKHHVNKIASACFYHIRRLRQIHHHVSREVLKQLATSLVLSRLDYCNAILASLPVSTLMPLQRAQNAATRLVLGLDHRSSITTALRDLHWPPVKHRITFKVATLMHQALHHRCPAYLADLVAFSLTDFHRQLCSTTTRTAAIQRTQTQFGRRAFSVCGPDVWNSLPPSVRTGDSNSSFRLALKTHLFQLAFNN